MSELRDYQEKLIGDIREQFKAGHKRVLAVSPTGSGKTNTTAHMIQRTVGGGRTSLFTVHRQELMDQSVDTFKAEGIEHGCIASGYQFNPAQPVQLASIDTLRRRLDRYPGQPSLIVIDEAAHSCSPTWEQVINHFPNSYVVGLTATPERLDGTGLGKIYTSMVQGPSVRWLIDNKYLSQYEVFEPKPPDLSGVETKLGDYEKHQAEGVMDTPTITGDAIREYKKHSDQKRAVAFCVSVAHSEHVAQQFRDAGVPAIHISGKTPRGERRAAVNAFRAGDIKVLTSVDIFGEGFDLPAMETAILLRPTQSLALYLQQVGRVLRPFPGKERAIILDHAGNVRRHFLPDEERTWSLEGKKRKKKKESESEIRIRIRNCPACLFVHRPSPACPYCGHVYEIQGREVDHVDGDLVPLDKSQIRKKKKVDLPVAKAKTLQELTDIGIERGYKNPEAWALYKLNGRKAAEQRRKGTAHA